MIYFLRCEQDAGPIKAGWIKIGTTRRLSERLKQIASEIGHMPTVMAVMPGSFADEHALHGEFAPSRMVGEWFDDSIALLRLIETEGKPWDGTDEVPSPNYAPVKVDAEVVTEAKMVAASRDITLAEYLSELVRPLVRRDLEQETARRIHPKSHKGKGEPK